MPDFEQITNDLQDVSDTVTRVQEAIADAAVEVAVNEEAADEDFNPATVAESLSRAAGELSGPKDLLDIQSAIMQAARELAPGVV